MKKNTIFALLAIALVIVSCGSKGAEEVQTEVKADVETVSENADVQTEEPSENQIENTLEAETTAEEIEASQAVSENAVSDNAVSSEVNLENPIKMYARQTANIRSMPTTEGSDILGQLAQNDEVEVVGYSDDTKEWSRISYQGLQTYVASKLLTDKPSTSRGTQAQTAQASTSAPKQASNPAPAAPAPTSGGDDNMCSMSTADILADLAASNTPSMGTDMGAGEGANIVVGDEVILE